MTSRVDLFVLRRAATFAAPTRETIAQDCCCIANIDARLERLAAAGFIVLEPRQRIRLTDLGIMTLAAEPTQARDRPGLTNR